MLSANCDVQVAGMIFQTRARTEENKKIKNVVVHLLKKEFYVKKVK